MFLPPHRSLAPSRALRRVPRWMRALLLLGFLALGGVASAQIEFDPNCPPTAWCHPDGSGLSFIEDAASQVGSDMVRRRETGDCTGLGPQGCLGVVLNQLMCVIDGRDWVQQYACAPGPVETPPAGGGAGGGGGGATPPTETPPAEEKPEPDPDAEALAAVSSPRLGQWLRDELDRTSAGERLARLRIGDRANLDLIVWGRYERERGASSYFAIVRALDSVDRRERLLIVGVRGDVVYIGDVERLRAGSRGDAAPTPFGDVLAQGGLR